MKVLIPSTSFDKVHETLEHLTKAQEYYKCPKMFNLFVRLSKRKKGRRGGTGILQKCVQPLHTWIRLVFYSFINSYGMGHPVPGWLQIPTKWCKTLRKPRPRRGAKLTRQSHGDNPVSRSPANDIFQTEQRLVPDRPV